MAILQVYSLYDIKTQWQNFTPRDKGVGNAPSVDQRFPNDQLLRPGDENAFSIRPMIRGAPLTISSATLRDKTTYLVSRQYL